MTGTVYLAIILAIIGGGYVLSFIVETLNVRHVSAALPAEFEGFYDPEKYRASQEYLKANTRFDLLSGGVFALGTILFILAGGFAAVDRFARSFNLGTLPTALIFAGLLLLVAEIVRLPFSVWHTFVIEEKFGFNRTTPLTFVLDRLKSWLLVGLLGGAVFAGVVWFFERFGAAAWLYSWGALTAFQLFLTFIAPVTILPLFNKFSPLEDGTLKQSIESYAREHAFKLKGIFTMDGSKRSTKSNAFFTGFGRFRRIVLFDTLIAKHTVEELVSVLAHEMGHYKKKHVLKFTLISILASGIMFFILSRFINNRGLFAAFGVEQTSVYASLVFFGFLYAPLSAIFAVATGVLSRRYEYEADAYAVETYRKPEAMATALKKLSVDNLSNLTPHPLKVFLEYSHPPVLERVRAIEHAKGNLN